MFCKSVCGTESNRDRGKATYPAAAEVVGWLGGGGSQADSAPTKHIPPRSLCLIRVQAVVPTLARREERDAIFKVD